MAKFRDSEGREWIVRLNTANIENIRERLDVDMVDFSGATYGRLCNDMLLLSRVIWLLCESQAEKQKVEPEDFGESIAGEPFDAALVAIQEAISDFFPPSKKSVFLKAVEKIRTVEEKAAAMAVGMMDDPATIEKWEKAATERLRMEMEKSLTLLRGATNSPDTSEA